MSSRVLEFVIPGDLQSETGGYVYDREVIAGLRSLGWRVRVHALDASFPDPTSEALARAERVLCALPEGACVLVDGLALCAMPALIEAHCRRLVFIALIHMTLASQIGLSRGSAERLRQQERRALQLVYHVIVTARGTKQLMPSYGVDPSRVSLVEPGVSKTAFIAQNRDRTQDGVVKLLCVATIHEGKGHELLIDALAQLVHLPWQLRCVGSLTRSRSTVRRITERLHDLRLLDRVSLLGEIPHAALGGLYLAADLFVLPTLRESYGMAVAEALAHGLPVISSRTGAISDLVGSRAGLLVDPGDVESLRAALERMLSDSTLRDTLRAGAQDACSRLIPWRQACSHMDAILARVCGGSG